jgi:hypothetical protein
MQDKARPGTAAGGPFAIATPLCGFLRRNKFSLHVWEGRKGHESPGAPSFAFFAKGGIANVGIEILGSHPSQNARRTPDFLSAAPASAACAAFCKENRMKLAGSIKLNRKSGSGAPAMVA